VVLDAPEVDALRLELQSFVHSVQGERAVVEWHSRAALALAPGGGGGPHHATAAPAAR
jgi:hypothetical protein